MDLEEDAASFANGPFRTLIVRSSTKLHNLVAFAWGRGWKSSRQMDVEASCITVATFLDFCYCGVDIENIGLPLLFFGPVYFFCVLLHCVKPKNTSKRDDVETKSVGRDKQTSVYLDATHVEKADIKSCCHQSVLLCSRSPKHAHQLQSHRAFQLIFCKVYKSKSVLKGMGFGKASGRCFVGQNIRTNHL